MHSHVTMGSQIIHNSMRVSSIHTQCNTVVTAVTMHLEPQSKGRGGITMHYSICYQNINGMHC